MNEKLKYDRYDAGRVFLGAILAPSILAAVVSIFLPFLGVESNGAIFNAIMLLCTQLGFFGVYAIYNWVLRKKFVYASCIKFKNKPLNYIIPILLGVVVLFGLNYFIDAFNIIFEKIGYSQPSDLPMPIDNIGWLIVNLLLLGVMPAICEELIFRGVIYNGLKDYNNIVAIFVSAALFSLMHASPLQTVYPFLFGIVLALVVKFTKSIVPGMIIHFVNNAIVIFISYLTKIGVLQEGAPLPVDQRIIFGIIGLIVVILVCYGVFYLLSKINKNDKEEVVEKEKTQKKINISLIVGIIVGILCWILTVLTYTILKK